VFIVFQLQGSGKCLQHCILNACDFEVLCMSILVVILKRQLTVTISFLCFQDTCELVSSYGKITSVQFRARGMHFCLSHHVQPVRGANPVFSPVSLFPWKWNFQNMKHTPHPYQLRRRFLHWFRCAINNISKIILTAFIITILQKQCKVMPHTALQGLMMAFTKSLACIIYGGRTEYLRNCSHLTNFRNISIISTNWIIQNNF
jgi:hypothetical protein